MYSPLTIHFFITDPYPFLIPYSPLSLSHRRHILSTAAVSVSLSARSGPGVPGREGAGILVSGH